MNPLERIRSDRAQARMLDDPNADICYLALASVEGEASVRTLVLRNIDGNRFSVFINKTSPKWRILSEGASWQLLLWYPSMQRQYRVSGEMEPLDEGTVVTNWHRRPLGSKYLDHTYETLAPQSSPIDSRETLVEAVNRLKGNWQGQDLQPPAMVAGIALVANRIEMLDLNREDRIHDRQVFTLREQSWHAQVLIP